MEPPPAVPDHPRVKTGGINPGHWGYFHSYSRATYQKLEVEEQDRRSIPIEPDKLEHDLPRGDETEAGETRGWFSHWRRGVGPTLRGWAKGSRGAVIHMLAVSAQKFGVVDEDGRRPRGPHLRGVGAQEGGHRRLWHRDRRRRLLPCQLDRAAPRASRWMQLTRSMLPLSVGRPHDAPAQRPSAPARPATASACLPTSRTRSWRSVGDL